MKTILAEALVVHGGGLTSEEELNGNTTQRMDTGLSAWHDGVAPMLALSGGYSFLLRTPPSKPEAVVMKAYAAQRGVPGENIRIEDRSLDTIGNVLFTKMELALPNNWEHLAVVTSKSHLPRTLSIYRHVFGNDFEVKGIAAPQVIGIKEKIYEPLGTIMMKEVLRGTKPGDHEAIKERLFDLVPGYEDGALSKLALSSLTGLFNHN